MTIAELHRATETLRAHLTPAVRTSDLARHAGVSRQYIGSVLRGERRPSAKLLAAAVELGIPVKGSPAATGTRTAGLTAPAGSLAGDFPPLNEDGRLDASPAVLREHSRQEASRGARSRH